MVADGKELSLPGGPQCGLIGFDASSTDLIHYALERAEIQEAFEFFLQVIRDHVRYPLWGLTTDLGRSRCFLAPVRSVFPEARHQACVVHYLGRWFPRLGVVHQKNKETNQLLRSIIQKTLLADSRLGAEEARDYLESQRDRFTSKSQRSAINSLLRNFDRYTAHFGEPLLPRDSNLAENVIGRLQQSVQSWRGLPGRLSTYNLLKVWLWFYRTSPLVNSRYEERRGKSPLQLGGFHHRPGWLPGALDSSAPR